VFDQGAWLRVKCSRRIRRRFHAGVAALHAPGAGTRGTLSHARARKRGCTAAHLNALASQVVQNSPTVVAPARACPTATAHHPFATPRLLLSPSCPKPSQPSDHLPLGAIITLPAAAGA
jgi:hypothetical protein